MRINVKASGNNEGVRSGRSDQSSAFNPFPNCSHGSACQSGSRKVKDLGGGKGAPWPFTLILFFISFHTGKQFRSCSSGFHYKFHLFIRKMFDSSKSGTFHPSECCFCLKDQCIHILYASFVLNIGKHCFISAVFFKYINEPLIYCSI